MCAAVMGLYCGCRETLFLPAGNYVLTLYDPTLAAHVSIVHVR
jgi:hypothetical protein